MSAITKEEREELRRLHEADDSKTIRAMANIDWMQHTLNDGGCCHVEDDGRLCGRADRWAGHGNPAFHIFVPLYVAATKLAKCNALPRLLDALDVAEAERDAAEAQAWAAMGSPDGTHDTTNVQRLCEAYAASKAKLAALVEKVERIKDIMGGHDGCQGFSSPEDVWGIADKALAAAKEQP